MRIKCCGITRPEDARYAESCGADAIGVVVFSGGSPAAWCHLNVHGKFSMQSAHLHNSRSITHEI